VVCADTNSNLAAKQYSSNYQRMLQANSGRKWRLITTTWVALFNLVLAAVFILFLVDMWTETPPMQRLAIQITQATIAFGLLLGIALELRHSRKAASWNVSAQIAAGVFVCSAFGMIIYDAKRRGLRLDGIEAMLLVYGFWVFAPCGVTYFLYSRSKRGMLRAQGESVQTRGM
jgi:carbon starvation protein CstA